MDTKLSLALILLTSICSSEIPAQLTVSVRALNDAGVATTRANNTTTTKNLPKGVDIKKFTKAHIFEQSPVYTSQMAFIYPPYQIGSSTSNRVKIAMSTLTKKKSGHKSQHTTDSKTGTPGSNKFRVTLATTKSMHVKIDWNFFASIYDASSLQVKFQAGKDTKTWALRAPGQKRDFGSLWLHVNGLKTFDLEMSGVCKPGTGNGSGHAGYDGFNAQLTMNILVVGNGSFKTFGVGCSKGKMGSNGVPVRGSVFEVTLNGDDAGKPCALLIGTSKDLWGKAKLPLDLSYMGAKGCWLNVSYSLPWYTTTDAAGNAKLRTYMSAFLPKGTFYVQWMLWQKSNPKGPPTLTRGAEIKF